jgi:hypothetical protein
MSGMRSEGSVDGDETLGLFVHLVFFLRVRISLEKEESEGSSHRQDYWRLAQKVE